MRRSFSKACTINDDASQKHDTAIGPAHKKHLYNPTHFTLTMIGVDGDIFIQIGLIFIIAALAAFMLRLLKQPQILAYVLVGVLLTPVLHIVTNTSIIESMSIVGIAFLLFIVGLEMDLKALKHVAFVSSVGGLIQIIILFVLGYLVALLLGFLSLEASYIGLVLSFSSTMVVLKLLSDRRQLNTLHGRIAVGILLMEDVVAIFALSVLSSINDFSLALLGIQLLKFLSLFIIAFLLSKYVFPSVFRFSAKHQELLLIMSLAVCFLFALGYFYLGFSIAIGAFVAGVALGNLDYNLEIIGKVKSLRDFFSLIFFVSLGMGLSLSALQRQWVPLVVLILIIILIKPFITMTLCSLFKYTQKPAFLTAVSLAQVSEFSLIIATQGLLFGHISQETFSLIVMVTLVSMSLTPYFVNYGQWFYRILRRPLRIFEVFTTEGLEYLPMDVKPTIVLCGYNRIGYSILRNLQHLKKKVLVVDYNPEIISLLVNQGYHCIYGDVSDEEIIARMNLRNLELLISTVPDMPDNLLLIRKVRQVNKKANIIVTASEIDGALKLYEHGADYVILPHFLGGEHVSHLIGKVREKKIKLGEERKRHIDDLYQRKQIGHEHPKH